jgi:hypothetical protein
VAYRIRQRNPRLSFVESHRLTVRERAKQ